MSEERIPKPADFKPEPTFPTGHRKEGLPRCTAWSRTKGRQCGNDPEDGRTKCGMHGGLTPRGPANASYKHGKYSSSIPSRLAIHYKNSREDENLISVREETALVEARIKELLGTLRKEGDALSTWKKLKTSVYRYRTTKDPEAKAVYLAEVIEGIEKGATQSEIWNDLFAAINLRDKLVNTEYKRLVQYGHVLGVEQMMSLLGRVLSIIKEFVDADKFSKIGRELERLVLSRTGSESERGRIGAYLPKPGDEAREIEAEA